MVSGEGRYDAKYLLIGEAPGRQEVISGRPFVGQSGMLLNDLLGMYGLTRDDCYITNVAKEMPLDPETRKICAPSAEELNYWRPWLDNELELSQSKKVLLLGATAYRAVVGEWVNAVPWGTVWRNNDKEVSVIWHPAYVLRNGLRNFPEWRAQADALLSQG